MFDLTNIINKYSELLEVEENNTIKTQLDSFLDNYLVYNKDNIPQDIYTDFEVVMDIINDEGIELEKRFLKIIKSNFFNTVLSHKNNAREKELRRLTVELSDFIRGLGHQRIGSGTHPQNYIAEKIREVADIIEPKKYKNPKVSMNDAWRNCLVEEAMRRFK